ncbi:hypothetical protein CAOG_05503 [Capsaspora owczarzaki ATCC 30864]|uniref:Uncharacterized protein n=1 Tax=Capsaspora owczarzaki (strain ATCC 30864) TaxID=595528 RepID=A0A0D2VUB8_CAPO3|nr:hypothetical protein CAOG_05503 [Capsaspora owczarzaki ATCC 30864]KJE94967.1 hypothetical protein CAOG_005503 [Capsaspora owczarzaki ATCC 30864]|eukprot:XP_004346176.2 hypothetical protein CAOG_05503 [Capsaspora owczarzaki ATCC 30864]
MARVARRVLLLAVTALACTLLLQPHRSSIAFAAQAQQRPDDAIERALDAAAEPIVLNDADAGAEPAARERIPDAKVDGRPPLGRAPDMDIADNKLNPDHIDPLFFGDDQVQRLPGAEALPPAVRGAGKPVAENELELPPPPAAAIGKHAPLGLQPLAGRLLEQNDVANPSLQKSHVVEISEPLDSRPRPASPKELLAAFQALYLSSPSEASPSLAMQPSEEALALSERRFSDSHRLAEKLSDAAETVMAAHDDHEGSSHGIVQEITPPLTRAEVIYALADVDIFSLDAKQVLLSARHRLSQGNLRNGLIGDDDQFNFESLEGVGNERKSESEDDSSEDSVVQELLEHADAMDQHEALLREFAAAQQRAASSSVRHPLISTLRSVLTSGLLPSSLSSSDGSQKKLFRETFTSIWTTIGDALPTKSGFSMIEWGSGDVSLAAISRSPAQAGVSSSGATTLPAPSTNSPSKSAAPPITTVSIFTRPARLREHLQARDALGARNNYVCFTPLQQLPSTVRKLGFNPYLQVQYSVILDLGALAGDLLPHELELLLAHILAISEITLIVDPYTERSAATVLIDNAVALAKINATVTVLPAPRNGAHVYKVTTRRAERPVLPEHASKVFPPTAVADGLVQPDDCLLQFNVREVPIAVNSTGGKNDSKGDAGFSNLKPDYRSGSGAPSAPPPQLIRTLNVTCGAISTRFNQLESLGPLVHIPILSLLTAGLVSSDVRFVLHRLLDGAGQLSLRDPWTLHLVGDTCQQLRFGNMSDASPRSASASAAAAAAAAPANPKVLGAAFGMKAQPVIEAAKAADPPSRLDKLRAAEVTWMDEAMDSAQDLRVWMESLQISPSAEFTSSSSSSSSSSSQHDRSAFILAARHSERIYAAHLAAVQASITADIRAASSMKSDNPAVAALIGSARRFTLLTYGSQLTLLSLKLAKLYPKATILACIPTREQLDIAEFRRTASLFSLTNAHIFTETWTTSLVERLHRLPDVVRYQVLGLDVLLPLLSLREQFPSYLGRILGNAHTTFVDLPNPLHLMRALQIVSTEHTEFSASSVAQLLRDLSSLVSRAAASVGAVATVRFVTGGETTWQDLSTATLDGLGTADDATLRPLLQAAVSGRMMLRVDIEHLSRQVDFDCAKGRITLEMGSPMAVTSLRFSAAKDTYPLLRAGNGVSLAFLLTLGPYQETLRGLFRRYLSLPVYADMCPINIVFRAQRLVFEDVLCETTGHIAGDAEVDLRAWNERALAASLVGQINQRAFSFLDLESGDGAVSMALADTFPLATVISMERRPEMIRRHRAALRELTVARFGSQSGHVQAEARAQAAGAAEDDAPAAGAVADVAVDSLLPPIALPNNVICEARLDPEFVHKLFESPEFMRYQLVSQDAWLTALVANSATSFDVMMGELLSTAMTTFIQMPSSQLLSLAFTTFFPKADAATFGAFTPPSPPSANRATTRQTLLDDRYETYELSNVYARDMHPLPHFIAEQRILAESARADTANTTIKVSVITPARSPAWVGESETAHRHNANKAHTDRSSSAKHQPDHGWSLVRADVRNLTVVVNHHFDYKVDGHTRKYTLHCETTDESWAVYLTRQLDGFRIPYQSLESITLIALLRMKLLPEFRDRFYDNFLTLPLYEDMAPWNIVFRNGRMEYIDYDTRDVTFDKQVRSAYQVMAMLMNYERTVRDFGHCPSHIKNQYGFPFISHCVGDNAVFSGPCTDSKFPVACGDGSCKSTYIECLRSLALLENSRDAFQRNEFDAFLSGTTNRATEQGLAVDGVGAGGVDVWTFDKSGIVRPVPAPPIPK